MTSRLRGLPSVDRVLSHPRLAELLRQYVRDAVVDAVRDQLEAARRAAAAGGPVPTVAEVVEAVASQTAAQASRWPQPVINATGVILHTNLGRAPLSEESLDAVAAAARGYSNLEMDLDEGRRGSRQQALAPLLARLTGAEDALVVNNNAGAVLLGLAAIASGQQVLVSRSEAVEIGGGFRVPDVLRQSGAKLVEVGTTNRTYARDYTDALTAKTGALLVVHRSNFRVVGFTHQPTLAELVELARPHGLPVLHDLGSGALLDTSAFGLGHEPMPQESLAAGVDLVFFSGDKLLGGPQAGIAVGQRELVRRLAAHPLARALRADKLTLAALHATLLHYLRGEVVERIPAWRMIAAPAERLRERARSWAEVLGSSAEVTAGSSTLGGGSLPGEVMETWLLGVDGAAFRGGAEGLRRALREWRTPVVVRIEEERVLVDPRTVLPEQEPELLAALSAVLARPSA